ncbi:MAG: patatin-like phospholipase family protein [Patiriisocius sp.]|uniref:patatin-like phospholipase family protein n=1 Tax=Patiriisocius sp. TaxID=2822396 RepID=UPI003EF261B2
MDNTNTNTKYKILSLDGGGTWALLQVLTLQYVFKNKYPQKDIKGHEVLRHFDLVIANSGGSMVLAALCCNWTFTEIINLFDNPETRNSIFTKLKFKDRFFPLNLLKVLGVNSIGSRYSTTAKRKALEDILLIDGKSKLKKIPLPDLPALIGKPSLEIIVATFDISNKRAKLFRSNSQSRARAEVIAGIPNFVVTDLVSAIHGSSNAPVNYFDFPAILQPKKSKKRFYLWDGALGGFNNPIMAGVTEAIANGIKRKDIYVLSIGTASKLVSEDDAIAFTNGYYETLLGKKAVLQKDGKRIHISETKKKKRLFGSNRWFKGKGFFFNSISNLSQSILFEPQYWATYSAFVHLFADELDNPKNNHRFVRLSPQIITTSASNELIKKLYNMDMDVTEQKEIETLKKCFEAWQNGEIVNEPVQWTKTLDGKYVFARGHATFYDGMKDVSWV